MTQVLQVIWIILCVVVLIWVTNKWFTSSCEDIKNSWYIQNVPKRCIEFKE